jgi:hypothetical protein
MHYVTKEGDVIMDCTFVPFHVIVGIIKHVESQNVAIAFMDHP